MKITESIISGLYIIDLEIHPDPRGYFKENWQNEKLTELGLPPVNPVQNNISFNGPAGVTRGLHVEPWNKYISVASGKVFGVWVDLRAGDNFGKVFSHEITPDVAVFVPRGVANGYQTLEPDTSYTYLVDAHWSPDAKYTFLNLADPALGIDWPISLDKAIISDKDRLPPNLSEITPIELKKKIVIGSNGQLGAALCAVYPDAIAVDRAELDITDFESLDKMDWSSIDTIINAAAYTNVDGAETDGLVPCWAVNAVGPRNLAKIAEKYHLTIVHISSDYVFDGTKENHMETEAFAPLSVYGASKAAGDLAISFAEKHYICRTSWLIGEGNNFVRTMLGLAEKGVEPKVVNDQFGRLTFTSELVAIIQHLLDSKAPYGTYNASNSGVVKSWADITRDIFDLSEHGHLNVTGISTEEYFADAKTKIAPRPTHSDFNLDKLHSTGFESTDWDIQLKDYIKKELSK